jgi:hypothetical protein
VLALGRYGPFRKQDRKTKAEFDVKSFIFSNEPSGWSFGVTEDLFGLYEQLVDITDDVTGNAHQIAQNELAMYVNEVGHCKSLTKNIEAYEQHDRSVDYYVSIERSEFLD